MNDLRNWRDINQRLVNRGRPSTYLKPAVAKQEVDLSTMNHKKVGKPYSFSNMLIIAAFAIKSVFKLGYREAAGNVKDFLDSISVKLHPDFRTIQWRVSQMERDGIKLMIRQKGKSNLKVIIDMSGVKSENDGEYRTVKYGKIKVWQEIHIAIDGETHKILNMEVTENDVKDTEEFIPLLKPITEMNDVDTVITDGGYDSEENFKYSDDNNIKTLIPVHINAIKGKHKRKRIEEQLGLDFRRGFPKRNIHLTKELRRQNQDQWKKTSGYHSRSLVETVFSVFKGAFGEYTFSKSKKMKKKELLLKAVVYNQFLT
jgi:hypothetical protein